MKSPVNPRCKNRMSLPSNLRRAPRNGDRASPYTRLAGDSVEKRFKKLFVVRDEVESPDLLARQEGKARPLPKPDVPRRKARTELEDMDHPVAPQGRAGLGKRGEISRREAQPRLLGELPRRRLGQRLARLRPP